MRLVFLAMLALLAGCCFTEVRRVRTLEPIREELSRDPTRATVAIVVTSDVIDPSMELITVTRHTPIVQTVRRPTTTLWSPGVRSRAGGSSWWTTSVSSRSTRSPRSSSTPSRS